ncbi:uncharacterized protein FFB20_09302 [Fusarium fujikuroi]|uniref:NACHT-NTPase and P-loop NTPases N-terminal domain-containing protein n=2 Tax=Fusarium fujikuroi TaxID=5127 RepID=S0E2X2_GIBF5|nr:uncharacterized protein FFUJ_14296 [Fusarium fujikuroi IMI 58289]KLP06709.1 uncharacterized protein Y057_11385 [Fusarium fujikuroi]KLP15691.1 uncharacterized protein LW94_13347 [Fusarium fujikuroi]QGI65243.1 hypothetical protein CEK27_009214 [Fusarium fujikuroi]QGI82492.1 hypothetical protein CEK25_009221 [Fusarium fujikuroi]QGI96125.1 hypothetical protein CEK26_009194 [Fusarium fujikuroi]
MDLIPWIDKITQALEPAQAAYKNLSDDNRFKFSFHRAGQRLNEVEAILEKIKSLLSKPENQSGDTTNGMKSLRSCKDTVDKTSRAFGHVARAPADARLKEYYTYLAHQGPEERVEVLVKEIMQLVCDLAQQVGIKDCVKLELADFEWHIERLEEELEALSQKEEKGGTIFGGQYNAKDLATQYNNTGTGAQNNGTVGEKSG